MAERIESVACPRCGLQIGPSSLFCPNCGMKLLFPGEVNRIRPAGMCPTCGSAVRQDSQFCTACGGKLTAYAPPVSQPPKKSPFALVAIIAVLLAALLIVAAFGAVLNGSIQGGRSELSPIAPSAPSSAGLIIHTFSWTYDNYHYSWNISIDYSQYIEYRNDGTQRYLTYTTDMNLVKSFITPKDQYIAAIARALDDSASSKGFDQMEEVNFILAFVQSVPYSEDINTTGRQEYFRFPVETLCDQVGDCEDKSFLFASITEALGFPTAMVAYDDHIGVGIACSGVYGTYYDVGGTRYFYCETTDAGWEIGELPPNLNKAQVIPLGLLPL